MLGLVEIALKAIFTAYQRLKRKCHRLERLILNLEMAKDFRSARCTYLGLLDKLSIPRPECRDVTWESMQLTMFVELFYVWNRQPQSCVGCFYTALISFYVLFTKKHKKPGSYILL